MTGEDDRHLMKQPEEGRFVAMESICFCNKKLRKGCHGFTVFGKAVLFGHDIESTKTRPCRRLQNRGTPISTAILSISRNSILQANLAISSDKGESERAFHGSGFAATVRPSALLASSSILSSFTFSGCWK